MPSGFLILPFVAGYLLARRTHVLQSRINRLQGHSLLLYVAQYGTFLMLLSLGMMIFFYPLTSDLYCLTNCLLENMTSKSSIPNEVRGTDVLLSMASIGAILLAPLCIKLTNLIISEREAIEKAAAKLGDPFFKIIFDSIQNRPDLLSLTLIDNKSYVGYLLFEPKPDRELSSLHVYVILRGIGEPMSREFKVYDSYIEDIGKTNPKVKIEVAIPVREIRSVGNFDISEFAKLQVQEGTSGS